MSNEAGIEDEHPLIPWLTEKRRAWFYRLAGALGGAAVLFGYVSEQRAVGIAGVVAAFLGTGLAAGNTSTKG